MSPGSPNPDAAALEAAVARALAPGHLVPAFQPIVGLHDAEVAGFEALARLGPDGPPPAALFDAAADLGLLTELECAARAAAFDAAAAWEDAGLLFLNHSPQVMAEAGFVAELGAAVAARPPLKPQHIVLEITERSDFGDLAILNRRITDLSRLGFQIALDDVGAGISGLNRIMALRPGWVKLDRELVIDIDTDPVRQNLLRSLVRFARMSNMRLVAEGIEGADELATLVRLGVRYGQGYYLGRPASPRPGLEPAARATILGLRGRTAPERAADLAAATLRGLLEPVAVVDRGMSAIEVADELERPGHPDTAALLDGRRYVGLVRRDVVLAACRRLAGAARIDTLEVRHGSLIAEDITVEELLELAASRPEAQLADPFVVQRDGEVVGIVTLRRLLEAAAETRRRVPAHAATLTGLPGRVQADQWLAGRIRAADPVNLAFVDLAGFDNFNAAYGFEAGDAMLLRLVSIVESVVTRSGADELVAHLGEDHLMIASREDLGERLHRLVVEFDAARGEFFPASDLEAGAFERTDEGGAARRCPLTSVRVVYLEQPLPGLGSPRSLHELVRRLRSARGADGDPIIRDRRRPAAAQRSIA